MLEHIANHEQYRTWNGQDGHHWADHHQRYDAMAGGFAGRLLDAAAIVEDDRVLDIGCGTGLTTRVAALRAHRGRAVGVDLSAPMLDRARRSAAAEGIGNVHFEQADAQVHPFPQRDFDVVISQAGVMFFADPAAAFTNIGRALRTGGRLAFVCHRDPAEEVQALFAALAAHLPMPEMQDHAPGVVDFADPEHVRAVLTAAGFDRTAVTGIEVPSVVGANAAEAADFLLAGQLSSMTRNAAPRAVDDARQAVIQVLLDCERGGVVRLPARGWLVTARTSG
ncbi:class I SAM-dependent methyltransferase [Saccharopolyspora indica]|uniref:class I SAM-dependent methyltransferase n=1 Tax=Saccharopolyspora indica TaxID=1229659 RepID=UPI0022EB2015|nr:class I SAM-dependent methyltransferase [Saccharopolyspora indica]MDA3643965.1 class I SAM-dependent methyltransferase [Saccharopolyspora indica]